MSRNFACVFPGQGSQSIGMMAELAESYPQVQDVFKQASEVLGYDLWQLCQQGPAERLDSTENTQPALLVASVAVWQLWQMKEAPLPKVLAGHSLGEYSALVCAGALDFKTAVRLVAKRGELMQAAVPPGIGAMAAIIGLDLAVVQRLCDELSTKDAYVAPANLNSPGQIVVSGHTAMVKKCIEEAKAAGAKIAQLLAVSVPSHSKLMSEAAEQFAAYLAETPITTPQIPLINNVDTAVESDPEKIKQALIRQLCSPVRWIETIEKVVNNYGVTTIYELGPGRVLTGLNKRIMRGVDMAPISEPEKLEAVVEGFAKNGGEYV